VQIPSLPSYKLYVSFRFINRSFYGRRYLKILIDTGDIRQQ